MPDVRITAPLSERVSCESARQLRLSTFHRPLRADQPEQVVRGVLGALSLVRGNESLVLQLVLGPRRIPLAVPNNSPSSVVMSWWEVGLVGNGGQVDGEKRSALREKVSDHGFAATLRLGVHAASATRRRELLMALFSALRLSEAPGVTLSLRYDVSRKLNQASGQFFWPLRLNSTELLALSAWPVGEEPLPTQSSPHPVGVRPRVGSAAPVNGSVLPAGWVARRRTQSAVLEHSLFSSLGVRVQGDYQHTTFGDSAGAIQGQNDLRLTTSTSIALATANSQSPGRRQAKSKPYETRSLLIDIPQLNNGAYISDFTRIMQQNNHIN